LEIRRNEEADAKSISKKVKAEIKKKLQDEVKAKTRSLIEQS